MGEGVHKASAVLWTRFSLEACLECLPSSPRMASAAVDVPNSIISLINVFLFYSYQRATGGSGRATSKRVCLFALLFAMVLPSWRLVPRLDVSADASPSCLRFPSSRRPRWGVRWVQSSLASNECCFQSPPRGGELRARSTRLHVLVTPDSRCLTVLGPHHEPWWASACSRARWGELCNAPWTGAPRPTARSLAHPLAREGRVRVGGSGGGVATHVALCRSGRGSAFATPRFRAPSEGRGKTEGAWQRRPSEGGVSTQMEHASLMHAAGPLDRQPPRTHRREPAAESGRDSLHRLWH